jgi:hypothetical protein
MRRLAWLTLLLASHGLGQTDPQLAALQETLQSLHAQADASAVNPAGGPKLTLAKHQLRDWIESQLGAIHQWGDETKVSETVNKALERVSVAPSDDNFLGYVGADLKWDSGLLVVTTHAGIVCASDSSLYVYKHVDGEWKRVLESEQNDYQHYSPQEIAAVHVWQSYQAGRETGPAYILALGNGGGCASAWHPVYYEIWRVDSSGSKKLIDESGDGYLRGERYIVGSIVNSPMHFSGPVDAIIEFTERSVDSGVHNREAVRHYLIEGDQVRRVAPVALSPRDFINEWMTQPWSASKDWSLSPDLLSWHQKLHADFVGGDFLDTLHCQTPDLWQVRFQPRDAKKNFEPEPSVYFLIRWTPPYTFALTGISDKPRPQCRQVDPDADAWRTLFSTQDWRY